MHRKPSVEYIAHNTLYLDVEIWVSSMAFIFWGFFFSTGISNLYTVFDVLSQRNIRNTWVFLIYTERALLYFFIAVVKRYDSESAQSTNKEAYFSLSPTLLFPFSRSVFDDERRESFLCSTRQTYTTRDISSDQKSFFRCTLQISWQVI